jgi:ABC-type antimicrobial peptide transport system permease subunit
LAFVVPSLIIGYFLALVGNWQLLGLIYTPEMGLSVSIWPDWYATIQAVMVGLFVPMISAIVPIQRALEKTVCDSMNTTRSKTKGSKV